MRLARAIGLRISYECSMHEYTRYMLAKKSGVPQSTVKYLFSGRNRSPRIDTIAKIANTLDMSLSDFFNCELFDDLDLYDEDDDDEDDT